MRPSMSGLFSMLILLVVIMFAAGCEPEVVDPASHVGIIAGRVLDDSLLQPMVGVQVSTNPATQSVLSDENGEYVINDVPVGMYEVVARAGVHHSSVFIRMDAGKTIRSDIRLVEQLP